MIRYFFRELIAVLLNNRIFTLVNLTGLSVGLSACLLILLYVQNETSYDKHWQDADRLYRVHTTFDLPGREPYRLSTASSLLAPALQNYFPDAVEGTSRAWTRDITYHIGDEQINDHVVAVDSTFAQFFSLERVNGSINDTLSNNNGIALQENMANRFFGSSDVLGETVTIDYQDGPVDYRVTAVYREPASNTILDVPALIRFDETRADFVLNTWNQVPTATYLKLAASVSPESVSARLNAFSDTTVDVSAMSPGPDTKASDRLRYDMAPMGGLYLDANFEDFTTGGNRTTVQAFSVIAVLIVLVASINFTVLSTARFSHRAGDVAMHKILGASRLQLLVRFIGESFLFVTFAMVLALGLGELVAPLFESLLGVSLAFDYTDSFSYFSLAGLLVVVSLLGGLYPALFLSRFSPTLVLRRETVNERGLLSLRNSLVIFQFGLSIALIIATAVIYLQVQYVSSRDPGFNPDNMIIVSDLFFRPDVAGNRELLQQEANQLPGVVNATLSGYHPMATTPFARVSSAHGFESRPGETFIMANTYVDENYLATWDIDLVGGRAFALGRDSTALPGTPNLTADDIAPRSVLLNEAGARMLGFTDPAQALGQVISDPSPFEDVNFTYEVIGIVADHQYYSLRAQPRPEITFYHPAYTDVLSVRYEGNPSIILASLERSWHEVMGDAVFNGELLDPYIAREFAQEKREGQMFIAFSLFAIFIAGLGFFGVSAFTVDRRTKEIGIRKVMGAEVSQIVSLLVWQFSKPVFVANVIAWPVALWAMLTWLQRFPYQIDTLLLIPLCVLAGFIALSIAWLTVAGNTVKVATTNPVYALRYE